MSTDSDSEIVELVEPSVSDLEALQELWSGGVMGLVGDSENLEALQELWVEPSVSDLEALQELWSGGVMGLVGDSENLEAPQELRSGGVVGLAGPTIEKREVMPVLRSGDSERKVVVSGGLIQGVVND